MNQLSPIILATRAISAEFIRREYLGTLVVVGLALVLMHIVNIILIGLSVWWWIAEIVLILITFIILVIATVLIVSLIILRPNQTNSQIEVVRSFVTTLQEVSELINTPKLMILFKLARDMLAPGGISFIEQTAIRNASLKIGFEAVVGAFSDIDPD